jgi:hypothetical protein
VYFPKVLGQPIDMIGKYFLHHHTHNLKVVGSNPTVATKV